MVPGQSIFLQNGQEGVLEEMVDGSNAVLIVGAAGKAMVVQERAKGKRTKLRLSALKNVEGVAALATGQQRQKETNGAELMRQVTLSYCPISKNVDL